MDTIEIKPWTLLVDREATTAVYRRMKLGGAERCGCESCRNWRAARDDHLPASLRRLLDSLGIDATKDVEVYEVQSDDVGVLYGGWFAFVGRVASGPDPASMPEGRPDEPGVVEQRYADIGDGCEVSFQSECPLLPSAFEGHEVASLDFSTTLPRVVERRKLP